MKGIDYKIFFEIKFVSRSSQRTAIQLNGLTIGLFGQFINVLQQQRSKTLASCYC